MPSFIHHSSLVDSESIGDNTKIWQWVHICEGAQIGRNCVIGQGCYIGPNVVIGDDTHIQNNAYIPEGVTIGNGVFIGPCCVFTNDKYPPSPKVNWRPTKVLDRASVGANSTIVCGIIIGQDAKIGAGSVVTHNVAKGTTVYGNPARCHK